jgi:hypothetical protein
MNVMAWLKWEQNGFLPKVSAFIIYLVVFLYILIFRIFNNVVGLGESEFFPIEIITTACILTAIIFIYFIYKKDLLKIGKSNILYSFLFVTFILYYLAENNWLLGRDHLVGVLVFGAIIGSVFMFSLFKIYNVNLEAGIIFGTAIIFLVFGTLVDASIDGYIPIDFGIDRVGLIEEVFELYASMFFLHSFIMLYFYSITQDNLDTIRRRTLIKIFMGTLLLGFGNSLLLQNRGESDSISRNLLGLLIIGLTLSMFYISFNMKKPSKNSNDIDNKNNALIR